MQDLTTRRGNIDKLTARNTIGAGPQHPGFYVYFTFQSGQRKRECHDAPDWELFIGSEANSTFSNIGDGDRECPFLLDDGQHSGHESKSSMFPIVPERSEERRC